MYIKAELKDVYAKYNKISLKCGQHCENWNILSALEKLITVKL